MYKKIFLISIIIIGSILFNPNIKNSKINTKSLNNSSTPVELPIARLIINSISVDNYIYNYNSKNNTIEKNIELLKGSILPNNDNSIVFLAAHSGNSNISYFNNLNKLKTNDYIEFYYLNHKYIYNVSKIYEQDKDGDIEIKKDANHQLILTTCSTTNKNKQLIVSSNLLKKEKIVFLKCTQCQGLNKKERV